MFSGKFYDEYPEEKSNLEKQVEALTNVYCEMQRDYLEIKDTMFNLIKYLTWMKYVKEPKQAKELDKKLKKKLKKKSLKLKLKTKAKRSANIPLKKPKKAA
mgnify:CR=1 FL=1